ncbi:hypothetical protein GY45DRAFT_1035093 [Cubamyces sp. BRFM 1775]|nr:hypothetical protein GY45DRAFT_1035093 [Cubamyces sp. BRFM 1775]
MTLRTRRRRREVPAQQLPWTGRRCAPVRVRGPSLWRRLRLRRRAHVAGSSGRRLVDVPAVWVDNRCGARRARRRHRGRTRVRVRLRRVRRGLVVRVVSRRGSRVVRVVILLTVSRLSAMRRVVCAVVGGRSQSRRTEARVTPQVTVLLLLWLLSTAVRLLLVCCRIASRSASSETGRIQEIHLVSGSSAARGTVVLLTTIPVFIWVGHRRRRTCERVVGRGLAPSTVQAHSANTGSTTRGSSGAVVVWRELRHVVALAGRHRRLRERAVSRVRVRRAKVGSAATSTTSLSETVVGIVVVINKGRCVGGFCSRFCDLTVELLGATPTDSIRDDGDGDDECGEADDSEDPCDSTFVLEEPAESVRRRSLHESWTESGRRETQGGYSPDLKNVRI